MTPSGNPGLSDFELFYQFADLIGMDAPFGLSVAFDFMAISLRRFSWKMFLFPHKVAPQDSKSLSLFRVILRLKNGLWAFSKECV